MKSLSSIFLIVIISATAHSNWSIAQSTIASTNLPTIVPSPINRYDVARNTEVTLERLKTSQLPEPKVGSYGEWIDVNENETVNVKVHSPLEGIVERDSLHAFLPNSTSTTLIYGTNARNPRIKPRYKMAVPEPLRLPSGSFLVKTLWNNGKSSAVTYPVTTFEEDFIQNPQPLDEERVIFQIGESFSERARFHLYILNWRTGQLRRLTAKRLSYTNWKIAPNKRYIALVRGVDSLGQRIGGAINAVQLKVLDTYSGRERLVTTNKSITEGDFCWSRENTLLYSVIGPSNPSQKLLTGEPKQDRVIWARPNIYEVSAMKGQPELIAEDAWRPSVSPDGKRLLFYGSEKPLAKRWLPVNWRINPSYSPLCIANRNGQNRKPLNTFAYYPQLLWFSDSQRILTFSQVNKPQYSGRLEEWDLKSGIKREIWPRRGTHDKASAGQSIDPTFKLLQFGADEKQLFVETEFVTDRNTYFRDAYDREVTIWKIDLTTGEIRKSAQFLNSFGIHISSSD